MSPARPQTPAGANDGGSVGNSRKRRSGKNRQGGSQPQAQSGNRQAGARRRAGGADFWGRPAEGPPSDRRVGPTVDPGALVRSLGDPPHGPNPATALAAANGLLELEEG